MHEIAIIYDILTHKRQSIQLKRNLEIHMTKISSNLPFSTT